MGGIEGITDWILILFSFKSVHYKCAATLSQGVLLLKYHHLKLFFQTDIFTWNKGQFLLRAGVLGSILALEGGLLSGEQTALCCVSWEQGLPVCYQGPSWCKWAAEEQLWGWLWCYKFTKCSPLKHSERQMDSVPASRDWSMAAAASLKIKKVVFLYQIKSVSELIVPWWEFCLQCELD